MDTGAITEEKLEAVQRKIQSLLERASHHNTPEAERQVCMDKANSLSLRYRIDMAMLGVRSRKARQPTWRTYRTDWHADFASERKGMQFSILEHFGCKVIEFFDRMETTGYPEDLALAEMMWASVHLQFVESLLPNWDIRKTFGENVYLIKTSGRSWAQIVDIAPDDFGLTMSSGPRLRKAYAKECERRGEEPRKQSMTPAKFRQSFAASFRTTIESRLRAIKVKDSKDLEEENLEGVVALRDAEAVVAEAFYERFPHMRPLSEEERARRTEQWREERLQHWLEAEAWWNGLTEAQRKREHDRNHRKWKREQRLSEAYWARHAPDQLGWSRGHEAAEKVDLGTDQKVSDRTQEALQ